LREGALKGRAMFHSGTQTLIDHWTALPEARRIPARADFQPMAFGVLTPQLFMVEREGARLRLAGAWVERAAWPDAWRRRLAVRLA
jgi:hypothetical protein